ncbi:hypothetical protein L0128_09160 [candidate division KSB1 bacterium]|nr:hypothetical protein [candidate division KSB1 bacterium]
MSINYIEFHPGRKRPWRTDILTNRMANPAVTISVWYQVEAPHILLRIDYDARTRMELKAIKPSPNK